MSVTSPLLYLLSRCTMSKTCIPVLVCRVEGTLALLLLVLRIYSQWKSTSLRDAPSEAPTANSRVQTRIPRLQARNMLTICLLAFSRTEDHSPLIRHCASRCERKMRMRDGIPVRACMHNIVYARTVDRRPRFTIIAKKKRNISIRLVLRRYGRMLQERE